MKKITIDSNKTCKILIILIIRNIIIDLEKIYIIIIRMQPLTPKYSIPVLSAFGIKTTHYILGAIALVVAISWSETIKSIINKYFPLPNTQMLANIMYSFIITLLLVSLIHILPDTTIELPNETKEKIEKAKNEEAKIVLNKKIKELEEHYKNIETENKELKKLIYDRLL
jgi:hypothetical protein